MQIFRPTFTHSPCVVILFGHAPLLQLGPGCAARLLHCSDAYVCTKEEKKKEWAKFRQRLTILFDESHEFRKTDTKTLLHNNNTPRLWKRVKWISGERIKLLKDKCYAPAAVESWNASFTSFINEFYSIFYSYSLLLFWLWTIHWLLYFKPF